MPLVPRSGFTAEQLVASLVAYHDEHGRWPTMPEWRGLDGVPSVSFIASHWGWRTALRMAGGESRRLTHCRHGHELRGPNVLIRAGGERRCLTCARRVASRGRTAAAACEVAARAA
jgi:hypothetical protein